MKLRAKLAEKILLLLNDEAKCKDLGKRNKIRVEKHFSWNTKGKELIFEIAPGSVVLIKTWLSHFEIFLIVTFGTERRLSRYTADTGRSVESIVIFWRVLRSIDLEDR